MKDKIFPLDLCFKLYWEMNSRFLEIPIIADIIILFVELMSWCRKIWKLLFSMNSFGLHHKLYAIVAFLKIDTLYVNVIGE